MISIADAITKNVSALRSVQRDLDAAYQDTLLDIGLSLISFTPLDTGGAQSNWEMEKETAAYSDPREPLSEDALISAIQSKIKTVRAGSNVVFYNNVDYIDELEGGKSPQATAGMIIPTKFRANGFWTSNLKKYNFIK